MLDVCGWFLDQVERIRAGLEGIALGQAHQDHAELSAGCSTPPRWSIACLMAETDASRGGEAVENAASGRWGEAIPAPGRDRPADPTREQPCCLKSVPCLDPAGRERPGL